MRHIAIATLLAATAALPAPALAGDLPYAPPPGADAGDWAGRSWISVLSECSGRIEAGIRDMAARGEASPADRKPLRNTVNRLQHRLAVDRGWSAGKPIPQDVMMTVRAAQLKEKAALDRDPTGPTWSITAAECAALNNHYDKQIGFTG